MLLANIIAASIVTTTLDQVELALASQVSTIIAIAIIDTHQSF
jgi:hypothetical protein